MLTEYSISFISFCVTNHNLITSDYFNPLLIGTLKPQSNGPYSDWYTGR